MEQELLDKDQAVRGEIGLAYTEQDLTPRECPAKVGTHDCYLREADGNITSKYQSTAINGSRFIRGSGEVVAGAGIGDVDLILLCGCIFYRANNRPVPPAIVRAWPNRVLKELIAKVKEMSGLRDDAEDNPEELQKEIARLQSRLEEVQSDPLGKLSSANGDGSD